MVLVAGDRLQALNEAPGPPGAGYAHAGVDPAYMGIGPVPATQKVLARTGLKVQDMGRDRGQRGLRRPGLRRGAGVLGLDPAKVSPNGSGISLGHPVAPRAIITTRPSPNCTALAGATRWSPCASAAARALPRSTNG